MSLDIAASVLATHRENRLAWYEREIDKRGKSFASIFKELRDDKDKPYLVAYESFDHYCEVRWGMTSRRVRQIIDADNGRLMLAAMTEGDPELSGVAAKLNDAQAVELGKLQPEEAVEVLGKVSRSQGKITAKKIKAANVQSVTIAPNLPMHTPAAPVIRETHHQCPECGHKF